MQHLEVSGAVRPLKWSLGVKWLTILSEIMSWKTKLWPYPQWYLIYYVGSTETKDRNFVSGNQRDSCV